ncbi:hypothetical protein NKH61_27815 [Mesorhizobium sp. M1005]|uniref:hypothetical protein n=1 Tax=unclassified Mesorhizobium TaxID=325217 RepID=UPI00333C6BF6
MMTYGGPCGDPNHRSPARHRTSFLAETGAQLLKDSKMLISVYRSTYMARMASEQNQAPPPWRSRLDWKADRRNGRSVMFLALLARYRSRDPFIHHRRQTMRQHPDSRAFDHCAPYLKRPPQDDETYYIAKARASDPDGLLS